jgi:hypothetical protein
MCTLTRTRLLSSIGASALMASAAVLVGPHPATNDNVTDFVGMEEDPFQ